MTAGFDSLGESDDPAEFAGPDVVLAAALAAGEDVAAAAEAAKISERTAYRRLSDPQFKRLVSELRGRMVSRALGK